MAIRYDYYDHPQHGDMHVIVPGKFIAFKGPAGRSAPIPLCGKLRCPKSN